MEREIKFEYGFEGVNGIVKKVYHISEIPRISHKCDIWNVLPLCYVRQYTGLKDKNGKEIYEGDILEDGAVVEWFDNLSWDSGGSLHPGFYCSKWLDIDDEDERELNYHNSFRNVTITGNIHEKAV